MAQSNISTDTIHNTHLSDHCFHLPKHGARTERKGAQTGSKAAESEHVVWNHFSQFSSLAEKLGSTGPTESDLKTE